MSETLVDAGPDPVEVGTAGSIYSCPECGSFLDAPRAHPPSGDLARKCASCCDWYPVAADRA
jgi:hypothetical protein